MALTSSRASTAASRPGDVLLEHHRACGSQRLPGDQRKGRRPRHRQGRLPTRVRCLALLAQRQGRRRTPLARRRRAGRRVGEWTRHPAPVPLSRTTRADDLPRVSGLTDGGDGAYSENAHQSPPARFRVPPQTSEIFAWNSRVAAAAARWVG
jgi:hypothetical protein